MSGNDYEALAAILKKSEPLTEAEKITVLKLLSKVAMEHDKRIIALEKHCR